MAKTRKSYKLRRYKTRRNKNKRNKKTLRKGLRKRRKTKKNLRGGLRAKTFKDRMSESKEKIDKIDTLSKDELEKLKKLLETTSDDVKSGNVTDDKKEQIDEDKEPYKTLFADLETYTQTVQDKLDGLNKPPSGGPKDTDPEKVPPPSEKVVESASEVGSSESAPPPPEKVVESASEVGSSENASPSLEEPVESASEVGSSGDAAEQSAEAEVPAAKEKRRGRNRWRQAGKTCEQNHGTVEDLARKVKNLSGRINRYLACIKGEKKSGGKKPRKRTRKRRRKKRR